VQCVVGCSTVTLEAPPLIGSVLAVKHSGYLKNGILRNPFFWRISGQLPFNEQQVFPRAFWIEPSNSREFFDQLGRKLEYKTLDDFYHIGADNMKKFGGAALLENYYKNSFIQALQDIYPQHKWLAWNVEQSVKMGFWDDKDNQKDFLNHLGTQLGFKTLNDWYNITAKKISKNRGARLLMRYGNHSPSKLLMSVYPSHAWGQGRFNTARRYWKNKDNYRDFLDNLGKQLGFKRMDDWIHITMKQIVENGGSTILLRHGRSPFKLLKSVYSKHNWNGFNFCKVGRRYWEKKENQKLFMNEFSKQLGIESMDDWYKISQKQIIDHGGLGLLTHYGNSLSLLITSIYSNHKWNQFGFGDFLQTYWGNKDNQRDFLDNLGNQLGLKRIDDWYAITSTKIIKRDGGKSLLRKYDYSPRKLFTAVYGNHKWISSKFPFTL
jgi:hypothetical protein